MLVISCHRLKGRTVPAKFKPPAAAPVRTPSPWSVACAAALHPGHDFYLMARCLPSLMAGDNDQPPKGGRQKKFFDKDKKEKAMDLYTLLTATRGLQILQKNSWPALALNIAENGCQMTMTGNISPEGLVSLLPQLAERGHLAKGAVTGLELLCGKNAVEATIWAQASGRTVNVDVSLNGVPQEQTLCQDYLKLALQDDLWVLCSDLWRDAEKILLHTGARYDGAHIFERESQNFIVAAEALSELPSKVKPGEMPLQAWLAEILQHGSEVLAICLVVYRDYGMLRISEFCMPEVCVIRPNSPVRHWLNREHVSTLTGIARRNIAIEREITSSFEKAKLLSDA
ncbi:hypothetical protein VWW13_003999 [Cronobacter sakazakii]|nr:hypothetical protein [Cronobacter sakazakii]